MDAKDLVVDDYREGEEIEHVGKVVPYVRVSIFARAFCVETVRLRDAARFVVTPDEVDSVRVAEFEAYEQRNRFNGEETTVYIVAYTGSLVSEGYVPQEAADSPRKR